MAPGEAASQPLTEVWVAQIKLNKLGFDTGKPDGRMGQRTQEALEKAGAGLGFPPTISGLYEHFGEESHRSSKPITSPAILEAIQKSVANDLKDPFSAQFQNIRQLPSGKICGEVNAKNSYGAYTGWTTFMTMSPIALPSGLQSSPASIDSADSQFMALTCLIDG